MAHNCQWFDDMADDSANDDTDEDEDDRTRWYENQDCNEIGEEAEEDNNDGVDNNANSLGGGGGDGSVITDRGNSTDCTSKGLGRIHPLYESIIADCIKNVFGIMTPKEWQLLLIQLIVLNTNAHKLQSLYIRRTGNGKSLPIQ